MKQVGIAIEKKLFTLKNMIAEFEGTQKDYRPTLTIHDYIPIAKEGNAVAVAVELEYVPAVEDVDNYKNAQIFLMAYFTVTRLGETHHHERCLACYPADKEKEEKRQKTQIANSRLKLLYREFEQASIKYEKKFFN